MTASVVCCAGAQYSNSRHIVGLMLMPYWRRRL